MARLWPLTGRGEELRRATGLLVASGTTAGVVFAGAAGVGKSRLAREVLDAVSSRSVTRWVGATASARAIPLGVFAEWVGEGRSDPIGLAGKVIDALTATVPGRRMVVAVDDAHLLDDFSAFVVHQLVVRRLARVVMTIRSGEPVAEALARLWTDGQLERVELQPLSRRESDRLLESVLAGPVSAGAARSMWELTRGNVLFLRKLVEEELTAERLRRTGASWIWQGPPVLSPTLAELIDAQMGTLPAGMGDVVDLLAVSEPLDAAVLAQLVPSEVIEAAEARGLVMAEPVDKRLMVRLAHPMFGEVRRERAGQIRLRRLRGKVVAALHDDTDMQAALRRAVLALDSDFPAGPELYLRGANAALGMLDLGLAAELSGVADRAGAGAEAAIMRAYALSLLGDGREAERVLAGVPSTTAPALRALALTIRAANLLWTVAQPDETVRALDEAVASSQSAGLPGAVAAMRTVVAAAHGRADDAIRLSDMVFRRDDVPDLATMLAIWGAIIAVSDLGRVDDIEAMAARGRQVADRSVHVGYHRIGLEFYHISGLRLVGCVRDATSAADRLRRQLQDVPGPPQMWGGAVAGLAAAGAGDIATARQRLTDALAGFAAVGSAEYAAYPFQIELAEAAGMAGDAGAAAAILDAAEAAPHPAFEYLRPRLLLARAWAYAAEGAVSQAITVARQAATLAAARNQPAQEVYCLQAATRFGDDTVVARFAELPDSAGWPRIRVAAAHAAALAAGDPDRLRAASVEWERIGDLSTAGDAAAQAAVLYRHGGRRGAALTAAERAHDLAASCGTLATPALRAAADISSLTARQRETVALAAQGLTNKQIADRLGVSVRTVEGHLYRIRGKTGVNIRAFSSSNAGGRE